MLMAIRKSRMKIFITIICLLGLTLSTEAKSKNKKLLEAVEKSDIIKAKKLIEKGADVNYVRYEGWLNLSVLDQAVLNENVELIKLLLDNNAEVNWQNDFGISAIIFAAGSGNIKIVN